MWYEVVVTEKDGVRTATVVHDDEETKTKTTKK